MIYALLGASFLVAVVALGVLFRRRCHKKSAQNQVVLLDNVLLVHTDERIMRPS